MISLDFETYYDKHYSLKRTGAWAYCFDPEKFDCYQVAVVTIDAEGVEKVLYVGHPRGFDWETLRGEEIFCAHNAGFDALVYKRLQQDGIIPADLNPKEWICTADMAVYFQAPRALRGAAEQLVGYIVSKEYRAKTMGKTSKQMEEEGNTAEVVAAGAGDAIGCIKIAHKYLPLWPAKERTISRLNREAGWRGVYIDVEGVRKGMALLAEQRLAALRLMVWAEDENDSPLSLAKIREYGRKVGIAVPSSLAAKSPEAKEWFSRYGESHPWVLAVRDYRRLNTFYQKLEILHKETDANGIYHFNIKYFGASTGRFSGGGRFNMQNLPRGTLFGVNLRSLIRARPGRKLITADYAQIEARILLWRVGDTEFVDLIREIGNIYIAYGIRTGKVKKGQRKSDLTAIMYLLLKSEVLGLGYGMGAAKYLTKTNNDIDDANLYAYLYAQRKGLPNPEPFLHITATDAKNAVAFYRESNQRVVNFWRHHNTWLQVSAGHKDESHDIRLASGRILRYFQPEFEISRRDDGSVSKQVVARTVLGGPKLHFYGGKLVENEIQATARDVLCDAWIQLAEKRPNGMDILFTAHDEFIGEVDEDQCTDGTRNAMREIMVTSSPWIAGAPLDAALDDIKYSDCYTK